MGSQQNNVLMGNSKLTWQLMSLSGHVAIALNGWVASQCRMHTLAAHPTFVDDIWRSMGQEGHAPNDFFDGYEGSKDPHEACILPRILYPGRNGVMVKLMAHEPKHPEFTVRYESPVLVHEPDMMLLLRAFIIWHDAASAIIETKTA